jgi:hypothetical protein
MRAPSSTMGRTSSDIGVPAITPAMRIMTPTTKSKSLSITASQ